VLSLLDAAGVGITAALGVGGRDLSEPVGGVSTRQALRRLDADPATDLILVVSKPPAPSVAADLVDFASELVTPVEFLLLGRGEPDLTAGTERALAALGRPAPTWPTWGERAASTRQGYLRGLFGGGTLCDEAMVIASETLGPVRSNIPLAPELGLDASLSASAHLMIDFGDDALTASRPHPMIDSTLRLEHFARFATDPATAGLLLDVVLGHGADPDPAADLAPAIRSAVVGGVPVVVALVGTAADPQGLDRQATALADAGAEVFASNAEATRRAVALVDEGGPS
jgi:FdrA protein